MNNEQTNSSTKRALEANSLVIIGGILLLCGILLLASGVETTGEVGIAFLGILSRPCIVVGLMVLCLGLVRKIKQDSLRYLRITLILLSSSIVVIIVLYTLLISVVFIVFRILASERAEKREAHVASRFFCQSSEYPYIDGEQKLAHRVS